MIIMPRRDRGRGNIASILARAGLSNSPGAASGSNDNRVQLVTNGGFGADANWTKATWTIAAGVADIAAGATDTMTQAIAIMPGVSYLVTFTVTAFTGGTVTAILGGTSGTARGSAATFAQIIKAGSTDSLISFSAAGATLTIDNVTVLQTG